MALDSCKGQASSKPCQRHSKSTYSRYKARLDAIGCICRALIALGEESCCTGRDASSKSRTRRSVGSASSRSSLSSTRSGGSDKRRGGTKKAVSSKRGCAKACCDAPGPRKKAAKSSCGQDEKACGTGCCAGSPTRSAPITKDCEDSCCAGGTTAVSPATKYCIDDCCADIPAPVSQVDDCMDSCCGEAAPKKPISTTLTTACDPEISLTGTEHVVLAISGMTCTGCETKLQRTLATLQPVNNLKTSLVLSRAEFDLDLQAMAPDDVIKHLERTTEFKCERITSRGSSLDLICTGDAALLVESKWPPGVIGMKIVDKTILRVEFDATIVGARDLVERGWGEPMRLAPPKPDQSLDAGARHVRNVGLSTLLSIILTIPVLVMAWAPLPENEVAYGSASLALATIIQVVIAGPFYPKALKAMVFSRVIEMDLLIVLSTSAAYIFSVVAFGHMVAGDPLSTGEFFETSTLLISLIMVGRYVAALARQKAVESTSIRSLQVAKATLCQDDGSTREIDARLLQYGDIFQVAPESSVPTDGTVLSGVSEVDESMMTGESRPVKKETASIVIAGSINGPGLLKVRLTQLPDSNTISTIASMVDEAKLSKPKIQETADRIASYFVPVVVGLTAITFSIWIAVGVAVQGKSGSEATTQAVTYAITVLIVSCPCAIGLAVPMVIVIAAGIAAERGVVFKSSEAIEVGYKTKHVVFDKTGTLTEGKLTVVEELFFGKDATDVKSLLLALVGSIKHPVSVAITHYLEAEGVLPAPDVMNPEAIVGKGVQATYRGATIRAGNSRWLGLSSDVRVTSMLDQGYTVFCFVQDNDLLAVLGLKDTLRSDASAVISKLHSMGIAVHLVSGDDDGPVREVAGQLQIPESFARSRCSPGDKQAYIKQISTANLEGSDKSRPITMFCGDGTNDAPALAQATIGVHVNQTSDIAKSAADIVLTRPNLSGILVAITISRKSIHRIAFNFGWSFVYNLFAVLLAAGAFVNARIPPAYAGLGELVSVLPVIIAGFLLRYARI